MIIFIFETSVERQAVAMFFFAARIQNMDCRTCKGMKPTDFGICFGLMIQFRLQNSRSF